MFGIPCKFSAQDRMEIAVHYPFVGMLSQSDKERFYQRLCKLMRSVRLHEKGVELTRQDRMIIAAPAVILTFGLKRFHWGNFKHLFVYPKAYKNKLTGAYHHGEASPNGAIVLSWERVKEGIDKPDDALHLLYHEYAHALVLSRANRYGRTDKKFIRSASEFTETYYNQTSVRHSELIRPYAFTNEMEFFAVIIEVLMESADKLKSDIPFLYRDLIELLNLEPWEEIILKQSTWFR